MGDVAVFLSTTMQPHRRLNFYGDACLHVLYCLNCLSKDLDFDKHAEIDLSRLQEDLLGLFRKSLGYVPAQVKTQWEENGILRATLKLPVHNELGLSLYPNDVLRLKVEINYHKRVAVLKNTPSCCMDILRDPHQKTALKNAVQ
jgi:hypothetical protein